MNKPTRRELAASLLTDIDIDGILAEGPPICDLCGEFEDQDPYNGREYNWNGETGNHVTCEEEFDPKKNTLAAFFSYRNR